MIHRLKICQKIALLPFLSTFGQWRDLVSSALSVLYPPWEFEENVVFPGSFCRGEMFIWSKLGQKRPEMEDSTFARIKKVIWDQLLAAKAEIIQSKLYFRFACKNVTK